MAGKVFSKHVEPFHRKVLLQLAQRELNAVIAVVLQAEREAANGQAAVAGAWGL